MSNTGRVVVPRPSRRGFRPRVTAAARLRLGLLAALVLLAASGLPGFLRQATRRAPGCARADAIVVLTGGALRVERGLSLLRAHAADRMLISGVGERVTMASLLAAIPEGERDAAPGSGDPALDRITLGHDAQTTTGNAAEIAAWSRARGFRSLLVVTAGYHMPRAMAELRAALPGVALLPCPVHPATGLRVVALEYAKYLAVEVGLAIGRNPARTG